MRKWNLSPGPRSFSKEENDAIFPFLLGFLRWKRAVTKETSWADPDQLELKKTHSYSNHTNLRGMDRMQSIFLKCKIVFKILYLRKWISRHSLMKVFSYWGKKIISNGKFPHVWEIRVSVFPRKRTKLWNSGKTFEIEPTFGIVREKVSRLHSSIQTKTCLGHEIERYWSLLNRPPQIQQGQWITIPNAWYLSFWRWACRFRASSAIFW